MITLTEHVAESCATCKFWLPDKTDMPNGNCRRYPAPQYSVSEHWCGEWRSNDPQNRVRQPEKNQ
jgi:hypothetical protein